MRKMLFITIFCLFFLFGCSSPIPISPTLVNLTPENTAAATPTIKINLTPTNEHADIQRCGTVTEVKFGEKKLMGKLIYSNKSYIDVVDLYTGEQRHLSDQFETAIVKIDRYEKIAIREDGSQSGTPKILKVFSSDLKLERVINLKSEWGRGFLEIPPGDWMVFVDENSGEKLLRDLILININNGEIKRIKQEFPGLEGVSSWDWSKSPIISVFDPTMTLILHQGKDLPINALVLWDIQKGKQIAEIFCEGGCGFPPLWSNDGKYVALNELIGGITIVNRKGEARTLTLIKKYFPEMWGIPGYTWSPDNQSLALWAQAKDNDEGPKLVLVDLNDQYLKEFCFTDSIQIPPSENEPKWSPDGQYIAAIVQGKDGQDVLMIVNVQTGDQYIFSDFAGRLYGWIK